MNEDASSSSAAERDKLFHLHPYTDALRHLEIGPMMIERGHGVYVFDMDGRRYIEALSGLWSVAVGFSEERLIDAAVRQLKRLPYYHCFAHKSHRPAASLAEKLVGIAPGSMSKAFFTNSGSEANDTAMKLIWYRANALATPAKKKIIARDRAYHGVTIASASLTGLPNNHRSFDLPIPVILRTGSPHYWREGQPGESSDEFVQRRANELEELILSEGPETIAAFWGEPLNGAGGVILPPEGYWKRIQEVLRKYDILLVIDEVITGFGRTGRMFGSETYQIDPDILILSKQLSSSYFPISAMLANDRVLAPIIDESSRIGVLGHGFTAGAHPVGAAVALENIAVIEERNLVGNAVEMGGLLFDGLNQFLDHPNVGDVRGVGLIAALELVSDRQSKSSSARAGDLGTTFCAEMQRLGIICRAIGDIIAFCPPLVIDRSQVGEIINATKHALSRLSVVDC